MAPLLSSRFEPEKLVRAGNVIAPPVMASVPLVKETQALPNCGSVPSVLTLTPVRLASLPSRIVLPPVSVTYIPWAVPFRLVRSGQLISPPLKALTTQ